MLIRFEPLDFMSKDKWESFLAVVNIPYINWKDIISVAVETKHVLATEKIGTVINTIPINPEVGPVNC